MSTNLIREFFESSPLAGGNADYVESLYDAWLADAGAVKKNGVNYDELSSAIAKKNRADRSLARQTRSRKLPA